MGNNFSVLQMVLKSDVQREGAKKFISCCEEDIENLENGEKDGSKQGVESLKGGDVANVLQPQMETTKEKNPKKDGKGWQKLGERKNQLIHKKRLNTYETSTTISDISEPSIETLKDILTEKLARAYQHFSEIEDSKGGDPEPMERKLMSGLALST